MSKVQVLLCDEIRVEDNGKFIAIGAYTEMIGLQSLPADMTLSILVVISDLKPGPHTANVAVTQSIDDEMPQFVNFPIHASDNGRATMRINGVRLSATQEVDINIRFAVNDEEPRLVDSVPVRIWLPT